MAIDIIIGALLGAGVAEGVNALTSASSKSGTGAGPTPVTPPSQSSANQAGETAVADQRATLLRAGGVTDYTGGLGVLTGSDVSKSSLIGG